MTEIVVVIAAGGMGMGVGAEVRIGRGCSSPTSRTTPHDVGTRPIRNWAASVAGGNDSVIPDIMYPASVIMVMPLTAAAASLQRKTSG